jgi:hypothetical protein
MLSEGKNASAHFIGGWLDSEAGLSGSKNRKKKTLAPAGIRTPDWPTRILIAILTAEQA